MTSGRITLALKALVLVGLVTFLLSTADLDAIAGHLARIPLSVFAAGIALMLSSLALQTVRWRLLLDDPSIRFRECLAFVGLGASLNMVSPSTVVADGVISYWMGRRTSNVLGAMSTLLAARLIGSLSAVVLFLAALASHLWVFERIPMEWSPRRILYAGAAGATLAAAIVLARRHRGKLGQLGHRALPAMKSPGTLAMVLALSVAIQALMFYAYYLGFRAIGAPVRLLDVFFFAPLITFAGMIPVSIGGIGVREGLGVFFYTLIPGVSREEVLSQAGYHYILMLGAALVNLAFAAAVLGPPWKAPAAPGAPARKARSASAPLKPASASAKPQPHGARTGSGSPVRKRPSAPPAP